MTRRPLPSADRERLRELIHCRTDAQVRVLFPGITPNTVARAAAGLPIQPATRQRILDRLATMEVQPWPGGLR
jgi:hypothetical protein